MKNKGSPSGLHTVMGRRRCGVFSIMCRGTSVPNSFMQVSEVYFVLLVFFLFAIVFFPFFVYSLLRANCPNESIARDGDIVVCYASAAGHWHLGIPSACITQLRVLSLPWIVIWPFPTHDGGARGLAREHDHDLVDWSLISLQIGVILTTPQEARRSCYCRHEMSSLSVLDGTLV